VSRPRALIYKLVTLGLLLAFVPLLPGAGRLLLGGTLLLKALSVIFNGPGLLVVAAATGAGAAAALPGRLAGWLLTLLILEPLLRWIERPGPRLPSSDPVEVERRLTRRSFLVSSGSLAAAGLMAGYGYGVERRNLQLEQYLLALPDLPPQLEGLRLVVMADWHCGPMNRPGDLRPALAMANSCRPDLILIPGDFVSMSGSRYFGEAAELANQLAPRVRGGVLIGWGNHDYWHGLDAGQRQMPQAGCQILTNRSLFLTADRMLADSGKEGLWLCGLDDLWAGQPDLVRTLGGLPAHQPRLVLSHNPDLAEEQWGARVDLMLSGHTHGGQVRLPALGTPVLPSRYGQKYASGLVSGPHFPVYVTRGVGVGGIPVRLGVPPEVTVFELRRGARLALARTRLL
jgi:predicted MPP superfamily phosphohydrolase